MNIHKFVFYPSLFMVIFLSVSCSDYRVGCDDGVPAESMRRASAVYASFEGLLEDEPRSSDFEKFSTNPANYHVSIVQVDDEFIYTFNLNPYHGEPVLDGQVTYKVSHSGKVELKGKL